VTDTTSSTRLGVKTQSVTSSRTRRVFVAYPYSLPKEDYRRPFDELAGAFDVEFQFADQEITNKQILDKIADMIVSARFSLFDVTTWNANVSLELGIAVGGGRPYYLLFNPAHPGNPTSDVPADLGGLDRIQYGSYSEMEAGLTMLLGQEFGVPSTTPSDPLAPFRERLPKVVAENPGMKIAEVAEQLGIAIGTAQLVVRPLVAAEDLETTGAKRGMRYYAKGATPRRR
jgi:hypothetical protein